MSTLLVAVVLLALAAIFFVILKKRASPDASDAQWPYYPKKPLTQPEQVLYHRLVAAMPECIVLAQMQLSQVLGVKIPPCVWWIPLRFIHPTRTARYTR